MSPEFWSISPHNFWIKGHFALFAAVLSPLQSDGTEYHGEIRTSERFAGSGIRFATHVPHFALLCHLEEQGALNLGLLQTTMELFANSALRPTVEKKQESGQQKPTVFHMMD